MVYQGHPVSGADEASGLALALALGLVQQQRRALGRALGWALGGAPKPGARQGLRQGLRQEPGLRGRELVILRRSIPWPRGGFRHRLQGERPSEAAERRKRTPFGL